MSSNQDEQSLNVPLPDPERLPSVMWGYHRWIIWRGEVRGEKIAKIPCAWDGSTHAMTDAAIQSSLPDALSAARNLRDRRGPCYGVGVAMADDSPFIVVDLDGDLRDGMSDRLSQTMTRYPTWCERSVSGRGAHLVFGGHRAGKSSKPIEVFGGKGFVAVTGDTLPSSTDEARAWDEAILDLFARPESVKPEAPKWTRTAPTPNGRYHAFGAAVLRDDCDKILASVDGYKHDTLRDAAYHVGHFIPVCYSFADAESALRDAIGSRGADDMGLAFRTIASGLRKGMEHPESPPEMDGGPEVDLSGFRVGGERAEPPEPEAAFQPFPVDALPELLRRFVSEGASAIGCDPSFIALPCLAIAAGLVGTSHWIVIKKNWKEPACLWTTIVAKPSSMKSPALELARKPLIRMQQGMDAVYGKLMTQYDDADAQWKAAKKQHDKTGEGDPPGERPTPPAKQEAFLTDTTIERLREILQNNPRGGLVVCDELATWFGSFARYRGKSGGSDSAQWLELWRAGVLKVHRVLGPKRDTFVPKALCSITGTIQPGTLRNHLTDELFDAGGPARLLFCLPPDRLKVWTENVVSEDAEAAWQHICERLSGFPGDQYLGMSHEAKELWIEYYNRGALRQYIANGPMAASLGKLEAYAARLALVHHLIGCAQSVDELPCQIGAASMAAGITLANWFAAEAERVYGMLAESKADVERRELLEMIHKNGGEITPRELMRRRKGKYPKAADAEAVLRGLVKAGSGRIITRGKSVVFTTLVASEAEGGEV